MYRVALVLVLAVGGHALGSCAKQRAEVVATHIDESRARELVIKRYRELFGGAYLHDEPSGRYVRYPALEPADLTYAEFRGDAWLVQADPPAGLIVRARVAPRGEWVELTSVVFSAW